MREVESGRPCVPMLPIASFAVLEAEFWGTGCGFTVTLW